MKPCPVCRTSADSVRGCRRRPGSAGAHRVPEPAHPPGQRPGSPDRPARWPRPPRRRGRTAWTRSAASTRSSTSSWSCRRTAPSTPTSAPSPARTGSRCGTAGRSPAWPGDRRPLPPPVRRPRRRQRRRPARLRQLRRRPRPRPDGRLPRPGVRAHDHCADPNEPGVQQRHRLRHARLPHPQRHPELLGLRPPLRAAGPDVRADPLLEPARAPVAGLGVVGPVHQPGRPSLRERARARRPLPRRRLGGGEQRPPPAGSRSTRGPT